MNITRHETEKVIMLEMINVCAEHQISGRQIPLKMIAKSGGTVVVLPLLELVVVFVYFTIQANAYLPGKWGRNEGITPHRSSL